MRFCWTVLVYLALAAAAVAADYQVVDGDTFHLGANTIRIENIDAPETHSAQCDAERRLGALATNRLTQLLASGRLELTRNPSDPRNTDRYGRLLRRVSVDGRDAGEVLIAEGLARPRLAGADPGADATRRASRGSDRSAAALGRSRTR